MASLVAAISGEGAQPEESIGEVFADGGGVFQPGLVLKRGPVKKPARALQKLVRVYRPMPRVISDLGDSFEAVPVLSRSLSVARTARKSASFYAQTFCPSNCQGTMFGLNKGDTSQGSWFLHPHDS